jgi:dipeptidyl aminopeptidase/acylaminoacyl peptidase
MTDALSPISASDLIGLRTPGVPAISPDGTRVIAVVAEVDFDKSEVRQQLYELAAGDPDPTERQWTHGLESVDDPAWSPTGDLLAFLTFRPQPHENEEDDRRDDGEHKRQVFLLPVAGGEARRLTEAAEGVEQFSWWPDGSGVAYVGLAPRSPAARAARRRRKENRDDAQVLHADRPDWELWFQPLEGRGRRLLGGLKSLEEFTISPDGNWLIYTTTHSGLPQDRERREAILVELATGTERVLTSGRGGVESAPSFLPTSARALLHVWADPSYPYCRQDLIAIDIQSAPVSSRPLLETIDRDLEEFVVLSDGRVVISVAAGMYSRLLVLDPQLEQITALPIERRLFRDLVAARHAPVVALVCEGPDRAAEVARLDLRDAAPKLELLSNLNPDQQQWRRARRSALQWVNEGFTHEGLLVLPDQSGSSPPPLLVWIHGGPHWRAIDSLKVYEAEAFAAAGWAIFAPQYRGSSGYGSPYALAIRGDLAGGDARDVLAGVEQLIALGLVDPQRIAVGGASYGGYLTNWLLASSDRFRAGISMMGIFDLHQDWATSEYETWEEHYLAGMPWEKSALYRDRSPLERAPAITAPVLILHGIEDENTPAHNSRALYRALVRLGRTAELVIYPREGHGFVEPRHRLDAFDRIREWLTRYVLGEAPIHLVERPIERDQVALSVLAQHARNDYAGIQPAVGRAFFELAIQLEVRDPGPDKIRVTPCGPSADLVLIDESGDRHRPIGVPLAVFGQSTLFDGQGFVEAGIGEDGRAPVLAFSSIFELPDHPARYRLECSSFPPIWLSFEPARPGEPDAPPEPVDGPLEGNR